MLSVVLGCRSPRQKRVSLRVTVEKVDAGLKARKPMIKMNTPLNSPTPDRTTPLLMCYAAGLSKENLHRVVAEPDWCPDCLKRTQHRELLKRNTPTNYGVFPMLQAQALHFSLETPAC
eukprot:2616955-Amphidinium_carterae.3